ncbi:MAG: hypothetical protein IJH55_09365 [Romboutsia sp.]|nr:hypothetical protein [Romboutsia sp.]
MIWNNDWRIELSHKYPEYYERLCDCVNTKKDIITMTKLNYKYNPFKEKEDCLDRILEWVTDWNSQVNLYPNTEEEYNSILNRI